MKEMVFEPSSVVCEACEKAIEEGDTLYCEDYLDSDDLLREIGVNAVYCESCYKVLFCEDCGELNQECECL